MIFHDFFCRPEVQEQVLGEINGDFSHRYHSRASAEVSLSDCDAILAQ